MRTHIKIDAEQPRTVMLEKMEVHIQSMVDEFPGAEYRYGSYKRFDHFAGAMVHGLSMYFYNHIVDKKEISYPSDWWNAFRLRFFSKFLTKRFPIKMTTVSLLAKAVYPDLVCDQRNKILMFALDGNGNEIQ